jgi:hypothetical protein
MNTKELLINNPSIRQILDFVEIEAQRIARERKAAGQAPAGQKK